MAPGPNPKHAIFDFIAKFCTICFIALRKRTKINKRRQSVAHTLNKSYQMAEVFDVLFALSVQKMSYELGSV